MTEMEHDQPSANSGQFKLVKPQKETRTMATKKTIPSWSTSAVKPRNTFARRALVFIGGALALLQSSMVVHAAASEQVPALRVTAPNGLGSALPAPAVAHIADLIQKHPGIQLEVWSEERVKDQLSLLRLDQLEDLFGAVPCSHDLDQIQLDELRPVVLALKKLEADANVSLMAPSVYKLQANALSNEAADLLKMGRRKEQLVQRFFDTYIDPTLGEDIAQAFRARYQALKDAKKSADEMFSELQIFSGGMTTGTPAHQGAVLAVMSYFFERCDIFEDALSAQTP
jgi:hypothetical protein